MKNDQPQIIDAEFEVVSESVPSEMIRPSRASTITKAEVINFTAVLRERGVGRRELDQSEPEVRQPDFGSAGNHDQNQVFSVPHRWLLYLPLVLLLALVAANRLTDGEMANWAGSLF